MVPLLKNKFFSDYLEKKGENTLASYNNVEKTKLQITVHSGSLEVTALYKNDYKISETFASKSDLQSMIVDLEDGLKPVSPDASVDPYYTKMKKDVRIRERIPVNFKFSALEDKTSYTL